MFIILCYVLLSRLVSLCLAESNSGAKCCSVQCTRYWNWLLRLQISFYAVIVALLIALNIVLVTV